MASRRELETIIRLAGNIDPSLRRALLDAQRRMGDVGSTSGKMSNLMSNAFKIATKAATVGAAAIGAGLIYIAKQGLDLASDLTEVQNVVDVTFGNSSKQIDAWAQTALSAYGLSELSAKQYSSTLGALMKSSGVSSESLVKMSENLTALSGDFASFYNLNPAEAFEKIKSGISGETEPLKALGINMSVANLEAYALSKGIKTAYSKMSQGDQVMLRYNFLLEKSADAQGDFQRTQGSLANQQRLASESFKQLSATIMSAAMPAVTDLFKKVNELISSFANSPEKIQMLQDIIANVANKVIELIPIAAGYVMDFVGFIGDLYDGAVKVYKYISKNWAVIEPVIIGIVSAMAAWKAITIGMKIYQGVMAGIRAGTLAAALAQWGLNTAVLANPMTWIIVGIATAIGAVVAGIYLLWKNWDAVSAFMVGLWQNNVLPFFQGLGAWFSGLWTGMIDGLKVAWSGVSSWFGTLFEGVKGTFTGFINTAIGGINKLIGGLNKIHFELPEWAGGQSFGIDIPMIPTFAKGGFANQPSIFGEAGPEAAIPLKRTPRSLSLLNKTANALGVDGGGGGSPQFIFAPVIGGGDSAGLSQTLKYASEDFIEQCERWWASKRRESFG